MASIVVALMALLMPGAGPPPTNMPIRAVKLVAMLPPCAGLNRELLDYSDAWATGIDLSAYCLVRCLGHWNQSNYRGANGQAVYCRPDILTRYLERSL